VRPAPTEAVQSGRALRFAHRLYALGPLVGLIALCIVGTLLNRDFATLDNMMNVLTRTSFIGIIAVDMTFVIISGGIDPSVGSMAALIAGSMIWLMNGLACYASRTAPASTHQTAISDHQPITRPGDDTPGSWGLGRELCWAWLAKGPIIGVGRW
jgi:ribose/xylose/arabinose/galactoside ABC-type transport system permease subunit